MEILTDKIKKTKQLLNSLKSTYNNIVKLVYEESWKKYNEQPSTEDLFRWSLSLIKSHYISKYWRYFFIKQTDWKSKEYLGYYTILQEDFNWRNGKEDIGKICYLKDLFSIIDWHKLWKFNVENNDTNCSLNEFIKLHKKNCYNLFLEYLENDKKGSLYLVNDKKLKIKNIVIYLF